MKVSLNISDQVAQDPAFSRANWLREIAIALFEQERLTLEGASQIADMHLMEFQKYIGHRGGCIHYDVQEFDEDLKNLRGRGWL